MRLKIKAINLLIALVLLMTLCFSIFYFYSLISPSSNVTTLQIPENESEVPIELLGWWERTYTGPINYSRIVPKENSELILHKSYKYLDPERYQRLIDNPDFKPTFSIGVVTFEDLFEKYREWNPGLNLNNPQEQFFIQIEHITAEHELNFILKLFYNYEEVYFQVGNSIEYVTEFLFSPQPNGVSGIPITLHNSLEKNNYANRLTVGIFLNPEMHTDYDEDLIWQMNSLMVNFEINFGNRENLPLITNSQPRNIMNIQMNTLMINQEFTKRTNDGARQPDTIVAYPNEIIELALSTQPHSFLKDDLHSFLVISMLDWKQIDMNGLPFLMYNVSYEDRLATFHDVFTIIAPNEPGMYEFIAFVIPNPGDKNTITNFYPMEMSMRFTIIVE